MALRRALNFLIIGCLLFLVSFELLVSVQQVKTTNTMITKTTEKGELIWFVDDPIGDVSAGFVDIVRGSILSNETHLTVIIKLKELPYQLYFDNPETPDNYLEYEWSLYVDIDGDPSTGSPYRNGTEVSISIQHFKRSGSLPKYGTIIDETQHDIWIFNSTDQSWRALWPAEVTVIEDFSTNSLIMVAPVRSIPWKTQEPSNLHFMTSYYHGEEDYAGIMSVHVRESPPLESAAVAIVAVTTLMSLSHFLARPINGAVSRMHIPNWLKDFLKLYAYKTFKALSREEVRDLKRKKLLTKRELLSLLLSAIVLLLVYTYVEVNGLQSFWNF